MFNALWLSILVVLHNSRAEPDFQKCMEVNTYGYRYDALYKIAAHAKNGTNRIDFAVKAVSDAHILLTPNPHILEISSIHDAGFSRAPKMIEVVIGGGKNSFSAIRQARLLGMTGATLTHTSTPNVLSADEYRGFWIEIDPKESISVGQAKNSTPFLVAIATDVQQGKIMQASYFGVSVWNGIKGNWKVGCGSEGQSESGDVLEETSLTPLQKLRRDIIMFSDTNMAPTVGEESVDVVLSMHYSRFFVDEKASTITVSGRIFLTWSDNRLKWDKYNYDNTTTSLMVSAAEVWTPDIQFFADGGLMSTDGLDGESAGVLVSSEGSAEWRPSFVTTFYCDLPIRNWPFDQHSCILHLGFAYMILEEHDVDYQTSIGKVVLDGAPAEQWQMHDVVAVSNWDVDLEFDHRDVPGGAFYVNFIFSRKSATNVSLMITPFIGMAMIGLSGLWFPPGRKAKLYLNCLSAVMLTFYLTDIAQEIPANALVPTIVVLYTWGLSLSCISILLYVIVENLTRCKCQLPYWCTLVLTSRITETALCFNSASVDTGIYNSLKKDSGISTDWLILTAAIERLMFIVYFCVYIVLCWSL